MSGPYTLSGKGIQAIAPSSALSVAPSGLTVIAQQGGANPPNLYHVALITPHSAAGWWPALPVTQNPAAIPLPNGCDQFGYAVNGASQMVVTEVPVVAQAAVGNPIRIQRSYNAQPPVNASTTLWSYTCPTGRACNLQLVQGALQHNLSTATGISIQMGSVILVQQWSDTAAGAGGYIVGNVPYQITMFAGDVITATAQTAPTTTGFMLVSLEGIEFDMSAFTPTVAALALG